MGRIIIKAYAKINLALDVVGKRADGYHEVEMIMQGINLYDLVELEKAGDELRLTCNVRELERTDNLAYKAAALLAKKYGIKPGLRINLQKNIPVEAGLGGGSTDAAAVILGINELYALNLTLDEMRESAALLGSDVPFCLLPLTALATGRGEKIKELPISPVMWLVLVKPPFGVSTGEAYNHLSRVSIISRPDLKAVIDAICNNRKDLIYQNIGNVLEYATYDLYPQLRVYVREIEALGARRVMMSGSGPTLITLHDSQDEARKLALSLIKPYWQVFVVRTTLQEDINGRRVLYE